MNYLAHIDSKKWAILPTKLNEMRSIAATNNGEIEKIASERLGGISARSSLISNSSSLKLNYGILNENGVAVIQVKGVLFNPEGLIDEILAIYFGGTSTPDLINDIDAVTNDPSVKAVAFHCHSPGGDVFGINQAAEKIAKLTAKKPTKAYIYGLGASACYGIAAQCGEIIVDAQALVGSIGVVTSWVDFTGFYEKLGIAYEEVTSSNAPYKRLDIRKDEERKVFMEEIDGIEAPFIKRIAKGRKVSVEYVKTNFGAGAVIAGELAVKAGLADRVGNFEQVVKELAKNSKNQASFGAEITEGEFEMGFKDDLRALAVKHGLMKEEEASASSESEDTPSNDLSRALASNNQPSAEIQTANARAEKAEKELAQMKADAIKTEAENFVSAEIQASRMTSAEKDQFVALYVQAASDDKANPLADGSRLDNLKTIQSKRKAHPFASEQLSDAKLLKGDETADEKMDASVKQQVDDYVGAETPNNK